MYYTYERISREVYDYCITNKLVDAGLIAKWKKPGYERLCSTYTINPKNYRFGTVSICRVPKQYLAPGMEIEDPMTGCRGCASGNGSNVFGNKYGQYLATIQIAREERQRQQEEDEDNDEEEKEDGDKAVETGHLKQSGANTAAVDNVYSGPVGAADGSSGEKATIWAKDGESVEIDESLLGVLDVDVEKEARAAAKHASKMTRQEEGHYGSHKKSKHS